MYSLIIASQLREHLHVLGEYPLIVLDFLSYFLVLPECHPMWCGCRGGAADHACRWVEVELRCPWTLARL